jgi:hypothetical protein
MDYGTLLVRAWRITWKHKILWLFGLLAGLASGGAGGRGSSGGGGQGGRGGLPPGLERQSDLLTPSVIAGVLLLALLVVIVLIVLSTIGRGGLIGGLRLADDRGAVAFGQAWESGTRFFWRLLGIETLLFIAGLFVFGFGLIVALVGVLTAGFGAFPFLPILCILILALIPLSLVAHFARFGVVIEDLSMMEAYRRSWGILRTCLVPIVLLGAIVLMISFVAGQVLVAPFVAAVLPAAIALVLNPEDPNISLVITSGLGLLCLLPIALLVISILETWQTSVWTLAYRQFIGSSSTAPAPPLPPQPG